MAVPVVFVEWKAFYTQEARSGLGRPLPVVYLLAHGEIRFGVARDGDRFGLVLGAFVPHDYGVAAVRNVFDFVIAAVIRFGKIGSWADNEISRHFRVYVAEQRYGARLIEGKRPLFTFGPRPEIVSCFLVAADSCPENIVLHIVAIQELNGCALLYDHDVRRKHQSFLVDDRLLFGSGKRFARDGVDVNHRLALHAANFALDIASPRCAAQTNHQYRQYRQYESLALHCVFLLWICK